MSSMSYDGKIEMDHMEMTLKVLLPDELTDELGWREDDSVEIDVDDNGNITIKNTDREY